MNFRNLVAKECTGFINRASVDILQKKQPATGRLLFLLSNSAEDYLISTIFFVSVMLPAVSR